MCASSASFSEDGVPTGIGLYIHVPFCANRCAYCAFYGEAPRRQKIETYLRCLEEEWQLRRPSEPIETVYFGGGTPGLLTAADFSQMAQISRGNLKAGRVEWTVEFAPAAVKAEKLELLRQLGVSRISLGVQSFDQKTLETLGRRQPSALVYRAIETIRSVGFDLNLDLIFHVPGQTRQRWFADLQQATEIQPDHLSTYCLTYEEKTPLEAKFSKNRGIGGEKFYLDTWEFLQCHGYEHYEVSNFAKPGHRCRHNLNVWRMGEWIGLGPAAASQWKGRRFVNVADLGRWERGILSGNPDEEDVVLLTHSMKMQDEIIFGLRLREGIRCDRLQLHYGAEFKKLEPYLLGLPGQKLAILEGETLRLSDRGLLVADAIAVEILSLETNSS